MDKNITKMLFQRRRDFLRVLIDRENALLPRGRGGNKVIANRLGMDSSLLSQIVTGHRNCGEEIARKIESALNMPIGALDQEPTNAPNARQSAGLGAALIGFHGSPIIAWDSPDDLPEGYQIIPRVRVLASAGTGKIIYEAEEHSQGNAFRSNWLSRKGCKADNCIMMKVEGDSMEPTYTEGTDLLVDRGETHIIDRKPYVLLHDGQQKVKRLFKSGDLVVMRSDNRDKYPDLTVPMSEIQIVGRVIWHAGED